jgi:plasmid stabilization system protein ParE
MTENPLQFPAIHRAVRRALVRRFPYTLFYVIEDEQVTVIACWHASRDPRQWQQRV